MLVDVGFVVETAEAGVRDLHAQLFADLTTSRLRHRFLRLSPSARELPAAPPIAVAYQEHATICIENHGGGAEASPPADQVVVEAAERAEKGASNLHR